MNIVDRKNFLIDETGAKRYIHSRSLRDTLFIEDKDPLLPRRHKRFYIIQKRVRLQEILSWRQY